MNKNITDISYSWNNLPEHILLARDNQNTIDYLYDAADTKLQKVTSSDRAAGLTTDYTGPFVYEDSKIAFIQTSEGRVVPDHDAFAYEYFLKDHLGNTRVVFNEQGAILQEKSYYPFGGIMEGLNYTAGLVPENKYLYNGKELQDDFGLDWYDYHARFYDAALGRFTTTDPHAENYYEWSPYHYVANNPIRLTDPTGMDWYEDKDGNLHWRKSSDKTYTDDDGNEYTNVGTEATFIVGDKAVYFGQKTDEDGNMTLYSERYTLDSDSELSEAQGFLLGQLNSDWSRDNAQEYWDNPTIGNGLKFAFSEALSQWTNPELVVGGLSAGAAGLSAMPKTAPRKSVGPIKGYTRHGLNQAISRNGGRGVRAAAIKDAVMNPKKVIQQSGGRVKYVGKKATVILNSKGKVITTYGKSRGPAN